MKFLTFAIVALIASLALVSPAHAQNGAFAPYADANVSVTGNGSNVVNLNLTGVSNPNYRVGGGIESSTKHFLLDANGQFDSSNINSLSGILSSRGGYTLTVTGSGYLKVAKVLLVGGGAFYSNQISNGEAAGTQVAFNRNQIRPFVGGGFNFKRDRLIVNYVLPGKDRLNSGDLNAGVITGFNDRTVNVQNELILGSSGLLHHVRLTQSFSISNQNGLGTLLSGVAGLRTSAVSGGVGVKFVL